MIAPLRSAMAGGHRLSLPWRTLAGLAGLALLVTFPGCLCGGQPCEPEQDHDPCTLDACTDGVPSHSYLGDGYPCTFGHLKGTCQAGRCSIPCKTSGDCNSGVACTYTTCSNGTCQIKLEDALPAPSDGNPCTQDLCLGGEPVYIPFPDGQEKCLGGDRTCDHGICASCKANADCGAPTECTTYACEQCTCVAKYAPPGTKVTNVNANVAGDCMTWVCDGAGGINLAEDVTDAPPSFDPCFKWACNGWTPVRQAQFHAGCIMLNGKGGFCDEQGVCRQCAIDADCASQGTLAPHCDKGLCIGCDDGIKNGDEVGIDCGGSCGACLGVSCFGDKDCASGYCVFTNQNPPQPAKICCNHPCDGICETCSGNGGFCVVVPVGGPDVDTCNTPDKACAGTQCKFKSGYPCGQAADCLSGVCSNKVCN